MTMRMEGGMVREREKENRIVPPPLGKHETCATTCKRDRDRYITAALVRRR